MQPRRTFFRALRPPLPRLYVADAARSRFSLRERESPVAPFTVLVRAREQICNLCPLSLGRPEIPPTDPRILPTWPTIEPPEDDRILPFATRTATCTQRYLAIARSRSPNA